MKIVGEYFPGRLPARENVEYFDPNVHTSPDGIMPFFPKEGGNHKNRDRVIALTLMGMGLGLATAVCANSENIVRFVEAHMGQ